MRHEIQREVHDEQGIRFALAWAEQLIRKGLAGDRSLLRQALAECRRILAMNR